MDALLAIVSKRDLRNFNGEALSDAEVARILDAGRLAGSARNRQPWRFVVVATPEGRERVASAVYVPDNVHSAGFVVAVLAPAAAGFDCGRAAQNMMLAAWAEGIASCPNGIADRATADAVLGPAEDETVHIVLSFGRRARPPQPETRTIEDWSRSAKRKPLEELVSRV